MHSFSVSDLKGRALKVKDASVHKLSNTRDKYSSTSGSKYSWDPSVKPPPPPPPATRSSAVVSRTQSSLRSSATPSPPPPPPSRTSEWTRPSPPTRHDQTPSHTPSPSLLHVPSSAQPSLVDSGNAPRVDWTNMTEDDKQVFFNWLDEFFESRLNISIAAKNTSPTPPPAAPAQSIQRTSRPATPPRPPTLPVWSRPSQQTLSTEADATSFTLSFPPPAMHGSAAADLAHYFSPNTHWDSAWYTSSDLPPPLQKESPPSHTVSWEMRGTMKTIYGGAVFPDLSMCWYSVQFPTAGYSDPNDSRTVKRSAKYLPRPAAKDRAALVEAHETYGETIAAFAESYEGTGQYCARGECWDLASEALKYFDQYDYVPKPVPSLSRAHGHLIFEGRVARGGAEQVGRWRGGDDRVRRGDIAEWRNVRIKMGAGGHAVLGQPDHTAVIVSETVPQVAVSDGASVRPSQIGSLEVVEQSVGKPPAREKYNLSGMEEGEVWIYRPISMVEYLGALLEPRCPDSVSAVSV